MKKIILFILSIFLTWGAMATATNTPIAYKVEVEGWTSLVALLVITMVDEEYGIVLPPEEMRKTNTIQELFDLVASKQ